MTRPTKHLPPPREYAHIYGGVKSRYRVSSYIEVPDEAVDDRMEYLQAMLRHATGGRAPEQGRLC